MKSSLKLFRFSLMFMIFSVESTNVPCYSQNNMPVLANVTPVSPNAASLGKFGEVPVGYFTGIPNISIPIYEINTGSLTLPISLSYHAAGVRVEDIASWVGLGWSLNSGGVISREVRGIADEASTGTGYLQEYSSISKYINGSMNPTQRQSYLDSIADNLIDSQQDIFTYNTSTGSGKFIFDSTGSVITIPNTKDKIEFGTYEGVSGSWKITDINGTQYYFTKQESTSPVVITNNSFSSNTPATSVTSWYISKIINALNTDSITFTYETTFQTFTTIGNQTKYIFIQGTDCGPRNPDETYSINSVSGFRLTSIHFKNGVIYFNKNSQQRCDYPTDQALSSIVIKNNDSTFYKKYLFDQSYLSTNSTNCDIDHPENSRLFLDSLEIWDKTSLISRYRFAYNKSVSLPSRRSYNQDYWGYFNGATNGNDFVPSTDILRFTTLDIVSGANRSPDENYAQAGILTDITYPTGGKTEFEYEGNRINNFPANQDYIASYNSQVFGNSTYQDVTFNIDDDFAGNNHGNVTISINNGGGDCSLAASFSCPVVTLYTPDNNSYQILNSYTASLPSGTYRVTIDLSGVTDQSIIDNFYLSFTWGVSALHSNSQANNMLAGGLRIKKITNFNSDGTKAMVKKYKYTLSSDSTFSSGAILSWPSFVGSLAYQYTTCEHTTISSSSNYPLSTAQGSYVQYSYIQELLGEYGEFGKNEYAFTTTADRVNTSLPFAPATSFDWKRGQLLYEKNYRYKASNDTYELIKEHICNYADNGTNVYQSLKSGQAVIPDPGVYYGNRAYVVAQYSTESGWFPLMNDTVRIYDQNDLNKYSQTIQSYGYGSNHYMPVVDTTKNSKGELIITRMKYPLDYVGLTGTSSITKGVKNLQSKNIVAPIIEKYVQIGNVDGSSQRVTNAIMTSYKTNLPLADTLWSTELSTPSGSFSQSGVSSGNIAKSILYKPEVVFLKYDSSGNIAEQQKINDIKRAYLWDYFKNNVVAECTNADSTSIAYTSFEADGTGNWTGINSGYINPMGGVTGDKHYKQNNFSISKSGLSSSNYYIVRYWSNSGYYFPSDGSYSIPGTQAGYPKVLRTLTIGIKVWTEYEHLVTGQSTITVSGSGAIDELRLYPRGATMTTYTYKPLVGMTSSTDANGRTTYYEYDGFGRLLVVRDQDRNVLKKYCYNYAGQQEQCNYYENAPINQNYFSQTCGSQSPSPYWVYVPQGRFVSNVSQADADQQARQYAQGQASEHGACGSTGVAFYYNNNTEYMFEIRLVNMSTWDEYWATADPFTGDVLAYVPAGTYSIDIDAGPGIRPILIGTSCTYEHLYTSEYGGSIQGVNLSNSCIISISQ